MADEPHLDVDTHWLEGDVLRNAVETESRVVPPPTGRVCVPIDPAKADQFDPTTVPTISQLADEIDQFAEDEGEKSVTKEYKKTSLREPVRIFEEFLSKLGESWRASNRQAAAVAAAAAAGAAGTGDHQGDVNMDF